MPTSTLPPQIQINFMSIKKIIDEDGESLKSFEDIVLDKIKTAKELKCFTMEYGEELQVDYWNAEATNEDGIPDIVVACKNGTTFFYDDIMGGELTDENELFVGNYRIEIR